VKIQFWLPMIALSSSLGCGSLDMCGNEVKARVSSPDGSREAVVFQRDCGATTGFSTQVSVLNRGEPFRESSSLWHATEFGNALVLGEHGASEARLRWNGNRELTILVNPQAKVHQVAPQVRDVTLHLERAASVQ